MDEIQVYSVQDTWIKWWKESSTHAQILHRLFLRKHPEAQRNAIWSGYWAVNEKAKAEEREAIKRGGLLLLVLP